MAIGFYFAAIILLFVWVLGVGLLRLCRLGAKVRDDMQAIRSRAVLSIDEVKVVADESPVGYRSVLSFHSSRKSPATGRESKPPSNRN